MRVQYSLLAIGLTIGFPVWAAEAPVVPMAATPDGAAKMAAPAAAEPVNVPAPTATEENKPQAEAKTEPQPEVVKKGPSKPKPVAIRAGLGSYYLDSAWELGNRPFYHLGVAYEVDPHCSYEVLLGMLRTKERYTSNDPFWMFEYSVAGRYHFSPWKSFRPLILVGVGGQNLEGMGNYDRRVQMLVGGVGIEYLVNEDYTVLLEGRQNWQRFKLPNRVAGEKRHHMDHAGVVNISIVGHFSFEGPRSYKK